ncbi:MAG TPA: response regulator transcription factor [Actinomycetota bacterium]|jgi:two-component system response regulator NreC|nr:response regulator transcription factor [Actinomycetota bacterium]
MTPEEEPTIRVVVVDDHNVVRSGLRMVLAASEGIDVVGDAESGEKAIHVLDEAFAGPEGAKPNVVVMDLMMDGIGGIEATRRIKQDWPEIAVLVLTMADDRAYLREAFAAGASGYVLKDAADIELVDAVRAVAEGGRYLHPSLGAELVRAEEDAARGPKTKHGVPLSRREVDVLRLVALGYANKEIADDLFISVRTVETHKTHIMQKTSLRARSELTKFARDAGIIPSDS